MSSPTDDAGNVDAVHREPPPWLRRWRFLVLLVATFVIMAALQELSVALSGLGVVELVVGVVSAAAALFGYDRLCKFVEGRTVIAELPRESAPSGLLWGMGIGAGLFVATIGIIAVFGGVDHIGGGGDWWKFLATIGVMACTAATEEVVFRGVVYRITEERFGTWIALVVSSIVFGAVHLAGKSEVSGGAEVLGVVGIMIQGGLVTGAAYAAGRALWAPIGIHFAWNLTEAGFGTAVSGKTSEFGSLVQTMLTGPTALTGGSFGPEASVTANVLALVPVVLLLRWAAKNGKVVRRGGSSSPRAAQA
ncbi:CPBP family intramembrane glutamic endopeptidase [Amycolatopsis pigmentata]|uniref:CPBP family intramembrane glutamic endopeptidase n=1 Tax=Amycolatopsis pigmentata TaxID=450801 RepID=A0ABW5G6T7_9PSEU